MYYRSLTDTLLSLFVEKNSDGTRHLRLKGKELWQRIGRRLHVLDSENLAQFLTAHPEIISLDLCYNDIKDDGLNILSDKFFSKPNQLLHLNLAHCDITAIGLNKLHDYHENIVLKSLILNGNKLGRQGGECVAMIIRDVPSLEYLEISDTDQQIRSIDAILMTAQRSNLKGLDISRILPSTKYALLDSSWVGINVAALLENSRTLTEIHLEKCGMDGHDVGKLLIGLQENRVLKLLNLASNRMGSFGLELIANWLKSRPQLLGLDVSYNEIGQIGARALGFGMAYSRLKFLNISYNNIDDDGLVSILDTLKKPFYLRLFCFYGNPFGQKSMKIIQRMLLSTVMNQDYIDTKLYLVDDRLCASYNPINHFKQVYYSVMQYGCRVELKIKRNVVEPPNKRKRPFYHLTHYQRFPPLDC